MRLNQFIARATGLSRRAADVAIAEGKVAINGHPAEVGTDVKPSDVVTLDGKPVFLHFQTITIVLNKPPGFVVSRDGQGSKTIYNLIPPEYWPLKPVGRLDKDSSGLLLLTNDGTIHHQLTHPSFQKEKVYEIELNKSLREADRLKIEEGVQLEDGSSSLSLNGSGQRWTVTMYEGRNRQIRRTFEALGYTVTKLHRTQFGPYKLLDLNPGSYREV